MLESESSPGHFEKNLSKEIHSIARKRYKIKIKESNGDYQSTFGNLEAKAEDEFAIKKCQTKRS